MGIYGCHEYFWGVMEILGVYAYLWVAQSPWVLYLNIKNIAYFLIQESQKIRKLQKTSEIIHIL